MSEIRKIQNYIGGQFLPPILGEYIEDINPANNELLALIPRSTKQDVDHAVQVAAEAYKKWSKVPYTDRANALEKIALKLEEKLQELALLESQDSGKTLKQAMVVDVPRAVANFRFFAGAIRHDTTQSTHMHDAINYTQRMPIGVCGLITPWNLPIYLLSWKVAPALAMGNTVVAKPSELTPLTANALAEIIHEVKEIPAGVFNIVHGYGPEAGQPLVESPIVRCLSFTGGTQTGTRVAQSAAKDFKKLSLELGGKNSTIVFDDCDFESTVEGAFRSSFLNQGQVCLAGSRLFIQNKIYQRFVDALVEKAKAVDIGDPLKCAFGCLSSAAHRDKVMSYIAVAREEGATILCGGHPPALPEPFNKGAFVPPTIITGLSPTSRCSVEEIFGPVLVVHPFEHEQEVIEYANNTRYGLAGSVWTNNLGRAHRVAQAIESGMIWVNCWLHRDLRVPFGGMKDSGTGREGGTLSLEFFSEMKNICIKHSNL